MPSDPRSIDNSHAELGDVLNHLVEELAANNHDFWARRRIGEGRRYGAGDDAVKESPVVVPYNELPDSEKEYARENAIETLKTIIDLGWTIQDPKHSVTKARFEELENRLLLHDHYRSAHEIDPPRRPDLEQILPIIAHAVGVFGDEKKASHWLRTPLPLLGDRSPSQLLAEQGGIDLIEQVLTRIEHNIPS
ncbi:MAG TPA: RyR domain-containing protein [Bryobacteraceae bacterium]|nr:RyR domain-containing protein [Bryobacteraceae bacterium]